MKESVPSDDAIAKLEKAVAAADKKLCIADDAAGGDPITAAPTSRAQIRLASLGPEDEARLMDVLVCKWELGKAMEALAVAREKHRVYEVVKAREEEINFGKDVDDCPICIEPLYAGVTGSRGRTCMGILPCCGKQICGPCSASLLKNHPDQRSGPFKECPLCRHPFPITPDVARRMMEKHAETKPHYQYLLGREYFDGLKPGGINNGNDQKALEYIKSGAEGGDAEAQALLAFFYNSGARGIVGKDREKALHWYELAASNGHLLAHLNVAWMLRDAMASGNDTHEQCFRMMTFAAHYGVVESQNMLSKSYSPFEGGDGFKSFEKEKYWLGKVVHSTEAEAKKRCGAYGNYAAVLLALQTQNMKGIADIAGYSAVPEAMFWFRKAKETNAITSKGLRLMNNCEELGSARCHCCKISSETYKLAKKGEMQKCRRCYWASYCSRACQLKHWETHKKDCKKKY